VRRYEILKSYRGDHISSPEIYNYRMLHEKMEISEEISFSKISEDL
jgi:hypothetical protein